MGMAFSAAAGLALGYVVSTLMDVFTAKPDSLLPGRQELLPDQVILLRAEPLLDLPIRRHERAAEGIRLGQDLGPRSCIDHQAAGLRTPIAFDHVELVAVRLAGIVQPGPVVESDGVHHQRIPFPLSSRIARPAVGLQVQVVGAASRKIRRKLCVLPSESMTTSCGV